jgi:hypothetical protein
MREFIESIARFTKDGECAECGQDGYEDNPECKNHERSDMTNDDAWETLHSVISQARELVKPPATDVQWTTVCPKCGADGQLKVVSVRLVATGKCIHPRTPLTPDGFEVDPHGKYERIKDQSTDNEIVRCGACRRRFDLEQLSLTS